MASTYLTSGNLSSAGNQKKWTISFWVKRAKLGATQGILDYSVNSTNYYNFSFKSTDGLTMFNNDGGTVSYELEPSMKFRDTSGWYHIVHQYDSEQATESNRAKLWVNGVQQSSWTNENYPSQGANTKIPNSGYAINIGRQYRANTDVKYFDGSLTHFHFTDGYAYDADTFGETDATTGIWKPKTAPSVTYGTNGFFLKFASAGSLGTDSSGNGNNFTLNGSGTQTQDTPSNVFATFNPLFGAETMAVNSTFSNGNTSVVNSGAVYNPYGTTLGVSSGKYYAEFKANANMGDGNIGIFAKLGASGDALGSQTQQYSWYFTASDGNIRSGGSNIVTSVGTVSANDIIGIALDCDNNKLYFHKNGTYISNGTGTGDPSTGTNGISITDPDDTDLGFYFMTAMDWGGSTRGNWSANFGNGYFGTTAVSSAQSPSDGIGLFEYSVPSGYKALCTKSINAQEYS